MPHPFRRLLSRFPGAVVLAALAVSGIVTACDTQVDVFKDSSISYSIYGALNVNAAQARVRVEKVDDGTFRGNPDPLDAEVRLRDLTAGRDVPVSLEREEVDGVTVTNAVTGESLAYEHDYRLSVSGPADSASVDLTAPSRPDFHISDTLEMAGCPPTGQPLTPVITFDVRDADRLAAFSVVVEVPEEATNPGEYLLERIGQVRETDGGFRYRMRVGRDLSEVARRAAGRTDERFPPPILPDSVWVIYATAEPSWPALGFQNESTERLAVPTNYSNVEGGVGFVGMVHLDRRRVPLEVEITC